MTTVPQFDDETPLADIYPLRDLRDLTDDQADKLTDLTRSAMRPLVETAWGELGFAVTWHRNPVLTLVDDPATATLLRRLEIGVWQTAYDRLDTDALWAQTTTI